MSTISAGTTLTTALVQVGDTSGNLELQSSGVTKLTVDSNGVSGTIVSGTAVSASGTSVDFSGIPSWAKRVTVIFSGISSNGTSNYTCRLGTSGGIVATGYSGLTIAQNGTSAAVLSTGFAFNPAPVAAGAYYGQIIINNLTDNTWVATGFTGRGDTAGAAQAFYVQGSVALGSLLTQLRVTAENGTDTFDAGTINIQYEG